MKVTENIRAAYGFKDTIFYKSNSDLQDRYDALDKLNSEYPNNEDLISELYIVKKGLDGENEISYQLKKSNIGMYVLRDIKFKYEDLTAQIDYVIITPVYIYYVECKNLVGNITVNDKGDFIRELNINGKVIKKGMYSPFRQVEAQREVVRKIWENNTSKFKKLVVGKDFNHFRKILVVVANHDTILNTALAPEDMKYNIIRSDTLVRRIQNDIDNRLYDDFYRSEKFMKDMAEKYIEISSNEVIDYYTYYKNKFFSKLIDVNDELKQRLVSLRKNKSANMNIPAYYVFTNDELDKLLELKPKTIEELEKSNILSQIKIKMHGKDIVEEINGNMD